MSFKPDPNFISCDVIWILTGEELARVRSIMAAHRVALLVDLPRHAKAVVGEIIRAAKLRRSTLT
jgi:hypothetical protein